MSIKTILFDLDGTIVNSNELISASFDYTFKKYNMNFTHEEILQFNGPPLKETFFKINPGYEDEMINTYREYNLGNHDVYIKLFPEVIDTINELIRRDVKVGIVTSKMRDAVQLGMKLTGIDHLFETDVTQDDVTHSKPHPESVLKAMNELAGETRSTLMVGDNYHDIVAGQNAGVQTAGVAWSQKGAEFLYGYKPTYMLQGMTDLLTIVGV